MNKVTFLLYGVFSCISMQAFAAWPFDNAADRFQETVRVNTCCKFKEKYTAAYREARQEREKVRSACGPNPIVRLINNGDQVTDAESDAWHRCINAANNSFQKDFDDICAKELSEQRVAEFECTKEGFSDKQCDAAARAGFERAVAECDR